MINRENLVKIGRAGGKTSNRETPDQIGRVGISEVVKHPTGFVTYYYYTMIGLSSHPLWFVLFKVTTLVSRFGILRVVVFHNIKFV